MEWQPIATAPKDTFIVLSDGGSLWHGFWHHDCWVTGYDDGRVYVRVILEPTHWAPLPAPPPSDK
jgi:hypothetical protein